MNDLSSKLLAARDISNPLKHTSVLYVEDDADVREQLSQFLERRVGKLYCASNGQEGLDAWHQHKPEVVVTDILMPVMDGLKMAEIIRRESVFTPIIVTTAFGEPEYLLRAINLGIDKYVLKPINVELLVLAIQKCAWEVKSRVEVQLAATVFDASSEAILITDSEHRIINVNAAFSRITGYAKDEIIGQTPKILNSGRHSAEFYQAQWQTLQETGRWSSEVWSRRKNGEIYAEWQSINTAKNNQGETTHHVAIFSDITERKQTEAELEQHRNHLQEMVEEQTVEVLQAKEIAETANHAKSEFLANMSHEIRTPMNGVIGMVDILQETQLSIEQRRMVRTIRDSSLALLDILNDIIDFSKVEAGKLTVEAIPTCVREIAESVAELLTSVTANQNIDLYVLISPDIPPWILSDPVRLRQVLINLLGNALKFIHHGDGRGGQVTLRAEKSILADGQPGLRLRIIDNGIGISAEVLAQLFQPFTQADNSTTRRFGGTGLGLSITKRLVELLHGQISVQSTPGLGSEFTVELPLLESSPARVLPTTPDLAGVRVIAVTCDPAYVEILPTYLRYAGAEVTVVPNMEVARKQLQDSVGMTVLLRDKSVVWKSSTNEKIVLPDQVGLVQLICRSGSSIYPKAVTIMVNPLLYYDLINGVAIAAGLLTVQDSVKKTDQRKYSRKTTPSVAEAESTGQLILLAEDNEINREVIQEQLHLLGYASEVAVGGCEALQRWRSGRYALLLTDYHMPNMDGTQLTAAIREEEPLGTHFPIIAVTANAMQGELERCLEKGIDDYLSKPLRLNKLGAMLAKWLPQAESEEKTMTDTNFKIPQITDTPTVVWDATMLTQMIGDNPAMHRRLLDIFLSSSEKHVAEINAAVAANNAVTVAEVTHKLKSAARTVGALQLGELCQELETAALTGKMQDTRTRATGLNGIFLAVTEQINKSNNSPTH